jgi:hypothetical protein
MRRLRAAALPLVVLLALGLACFARLAAEPTGLIVDGARPSVDFANHGDPRPVGNDVTFLFLPHHLYISRVLNEFGHPPAWDGSGFGGRPMVGNPQGGMFYPPAWLAWIFPTPASLGWLTTLHLLWGGLGLYALARGEGLRRWPATVAAGTFQASPYLLAQTFEGHYPHVWAACWFPWAFWALAEHRRARSRGLIVLPPVLALTYLTGHPQEWLLLVVALSIWVAADAVLTACMRSPLVEWVKPTELRKDDGFHPPYNSLNRLLIPPPSLPRDRGGLASATSKLLCWAGALAMGLGMAAVELVPAYRVLPWVQRAAVPEGASNLPKNYDIHPINTFQLISPRALGGPADYFGDDNYWESVCSFGLGALVLIVAAVVSSRSRSQILPWVILIVLSAWFATGHQLGLFSMLYRVVPGMSWFRVPARSLFLATLGAAMLAGFGLEALVAKLARRDRWRAFAVRLLKSAALLIGSLLICSTIGALTSPGGPAGPTIATGLKNRERAVRAAGRMLQDPPFWITVASLAAAGGLGCLSTRRPCRGMAAPLIGVFTLAELAWHGFVLIQVAPAASFLRADPASEALLLLPDASVVEQDPLRIRARDNFYLDLQAVRYGIEKTNINDSFQLGHASALYETLYPVATRTAPLPETPMSQAVEEYHRRVRGGVFDRMAVSYLISDRVEPDPAWPVVATGSRDGNIFVIQRNPTALPRAYVVPRAEVVPDDAPLVLSRFSFSDPRASVLMAHDPLARLAAGRRQPSTPARWVSHDPDRPVLEVTTEAPGLLVIADTWMPGWSARVDGEPVRILRGNIAQRVIPLERPGHHRVSLEYAPPGLAQGLAITAVSFVLWALLAGTRVLRGREADLDPYRPSPALAGTHDRNQRHPSLLPRSGSGGNPAHEVGPKAG